MHRIGFSGGAINLIFDLLFPLMAIVLIAKIFMQLKFRKSDSYLAALLILSIPVLLGRSNPFYTPLIDFNISSGAIQWITMPEAYYPPLFRSPEPQFTLTLVALAVLVSVKKNTFIPLYMVMPFLYPFVQIPFMFMVLAMHMFALNKEKNIFKTKLALFASGLLAYGSISLLIIIYQEVFLSGMRVEEFLVSTRVPLLSFTGAVCLLLFLIVRNIVDERFRLFLAVLALSPIAAVNTQIITGVIAQPNSFEQYYGTVCISLLVAFGVISIKSKQWLKGLAGGLGLFLIIAYTRTIFSVNSSTHFNRPLPRILVEKLKIDSSKVIADSEGMASALNLVLPMQGITGLSMAQSFAIVAEDYFNNYLCLKVRISGNEKLYPFYKNTVDRLGEGYRYLHSNFIFTHINRKKNFKTFYDPETIPQNCPEMELYYLLNE